VFYGARAENETTTTTEHSNTTDFTTTTGSSLVTTTLSPKIKCENAGSSCEDCVKVAECYYCTTTEKCEHYPYKHVFPSPKECDMGDVRWGVCWFNFKAMVISMAVIGGVLLISLTICICCCCRRRNRSKLVQEEAKYEREREERRIRNLQRQKEKTSKYDEIRKKYGLVKDDHPYQRFEA